MKNLILVGAGGCGREVLQWAKDVNRVSPRWKIKGFLDDSLDALDGKSCDASIIGPIADYSPEEDDEFLCCIGSSVARERVSDALLARGAKFTTLVHPTAVVSDASELGDGVIAYPFALVSPNARIGRGCIINMYSSVAHDSTLGEFCTISAHCDITGACQLGARVFMGTTSQVTPRGIVGDDVWICAGSCVMTRARNGVKLLGVPAKIVKF